MIRGKIRKGQRIALLKHDGKRVDINIKQLYAFDRLGRISTWTSRREGR